MEAARSLGAFYTPARLAEPLCRWAVREATDTILDPSCGEGAFLTRAVERLQRLGAPPRRLPDQIVGVELNLRALARARGALLSCNPGLRWGRLAQDDFFLFARENLDKIRFDCVVGNPPFLRTQGRSAAVKQRELLAARACGAALTANASAWASFVAVSSGFVKPGGRLAMIVPREALFVNYTKPLISMLEKRFASVNLVALDDLWFEGALVKVALLLCEGVGPGTLRLHEASRLDGLATMIEAAPVAVPAASWVWSRVPADCRPAATMALESAPLAPLTELAAVSIGIVTGQKDYFLLTAGRAAELGLPRGLLLPALSKPSQLAGTTFTAADIAVLERGGEACRLLAVPPAYAGGHDELDTYLARGVDQGVSLNFKCRTRKPWYAVRRVLEPPHAFLGYLVKWRPRLSANTAGATCTNNLHRVWFRKPWEGSAALIAAASLNAATMLSVELLERVAGGGVLKIEPGDAPKIRVPRPESLLRLKRAPERAAAIDRALREGRDWDAYAMADDLVRQATGWKEREVARLRRAQLELRDARLKPA